MLAGPFPLKSNSSGPANAAAPENALFCACRARKLALADEMKGSHCSNRLTDRSSLEKSVSLHWLASRLLNSETLSPVDHAIVDDGYADSGNMQFSHPFRQCVTSVRIIFDNNGLGKTVLDFLHMLLRFSWQHRGSW